MLKSYVSLVLSVVCILFAAAVHAEDVNLAIEENGAIFSYLLDTGTTSPEPLNSEAIEAKVGWILLEEDDLDHQFKGDAVLLNDKIAIVLRKDSTGARIYTLGEGLPNYQATLSPIDGYDNPDAFDPISIWGGHSEAPKLLESLEITENNPGAVMVKATFKSKGESKMTLSYRLTTGQIQVEILPEAGVDAIFVSSMPTYVVVPDFFADDLVYAADTFDGVWAGLPAENFLLHLAGEGDAIITCAWESTGRNTRVLTGVIEKTHRLLGTSIECVPGKKVWAAFADHPDSWQQVTIPAGKTGSDIALDWTPPFSAKWRGNVVQSAELAQSWNFVEERIGEHMLPGVGNIVYPCWFDADRPFLHLPEGTGDADTPVVIYPIDRTQQTPLNLFVLVDVMRNTLGMGPCQYILDLEGLDAQTSPTPALVCDWIENRFKKKRAAKDAKKIEARLGDMVAHVEHAEGRIAAYNAFAGELLDYLAAEKVDAPAIQRLLEEMRAAIDQLAAARKSPEYAKEESQKLLALIGDDAWQEPFDVINHDLHALGKAQDRSLSSCRMSLRRLRQYALALAETSPEGKAAADEIRQRVDRMLQEKG